MTIEYKLEDEETGAKGSLIYDDNPDAKPVSFAVLSDDMKLVNKLEKYFNRKREFYIPESQLIDDYRKDYARPVDELTYFEISITELSSRIGVDFNE